MAEKVELPVTAWAVLGQLTFGEELSGYDLKRWADQSLAFFYWAPSQSQIYGELRRLEHRGLASSRIDQTYDARSRRLYAITEAGQQAFEEWIQGGEVEPVVLKHPLMLRVWAADAAAAETLVPLIGRYITELSERARLAGEHALGAERNPAWRFPRVALEWSERYYRDEVARLEWLIERLREEGVGTAE